MDIGMKNFHRLWKNLGRLSVLLATIFQSFQVE